MLNWSCHQGLTWLSEFMTEFVPNNVEIWNSESNSTILTDDCMSICQSKSVITTFDLRLFKSAGYYQIHREGNMIRLIRNCGWMTVAVVSYLSCSSSVWLETFPDMWHSTGWLLHLDLTLCHLVHLHLHHVHNLNLQQQQCMCMTRDIPGYVTFHWLTSSSGSLSSCSSSSPPCS